MSLSRNVRVAATGAIVATSITSVTAAMYGFDRILPPNPFKMEDIAPALDHLASVLPEARWGYGQKPTVPDAKAGLPPGYVDNSEPITGFDPDKSYTVQEDPDTIKVNPVTNQPMANLPIPDRSMTQAALAAPVPTPAPVQQPAAPAPVKPAQNDGYIMYLATWQNVFWIEQTIVDTHCNEGWRNFLQNEMVRKSYFYYGKPIEQIPRDEQLKMIEQGKVEAAQFIYGPTPDLVWTNPVHVAKFEQFVRDSEDLCPDLKKTPVKGARLAQ